MTARAHPECRQGLRASPSNVALNTTNTTSIPTPNTTKNVPSQNNIRE
jgi:hypothetical protein